MEFETPGVLFDQWNDCLGKKGTKKRNTTVTVDRREGSSFVETK